MPNAVNPGEVNIELDGKTVTLRSTLRAARTVSAAMDGFVGAYQRIARYDLGAFATIVAAGLGKRTPAEVEEIEEAVYRTGLPALAGPLTRYVALLQNGGREPAADGDAKPGEA